MNMKFLGTRRRRESLVISSGPKLPSDRDKVDPQVGVHVVNRLQMGRQLRRNLLFPLKDVNDLESLGMFIVEDIERGSVEVGQIIGLW